MKLPADCATIDEVRQAIDTIDQRIIASLDLRFQYVKAITRFKTTADDVRAPERYAAVIASRREWATAAGLEPDVIEKLYHLLISYAIEEELELLEASDQQRANRESSEKLQSEQIEAG